MFKFSKTSQARLVTCHPELQMIFNYVIRYFDCKIICGYRTTQEQQKLFEQGRKFSKGKWIIKKPSKIVTYCDGINEKSKHNYMPSQAIDVIPYPIEWKNVNRMRYFIGFVKGIARMLLEYGQTDYELITGIDWDNDTRLKDTRFLDFPHFQLNI